jgi:hypothetical protein
MKTAPSRTPAQPAPAPAPRPPSERGPWLLACSIAATGVAVLLAILSGAVGRASTVPAPPILFAAATPSPAVAPVAGAPGSTAAARPPGLPAGDTRRGGPGAPIVAHPSARVQAIAAQRLARGPESAIATRWMEGFYPIYATAQKSFRVNWLLLASIHMQESAFSTAPSTYHGLNFARCCGGPMQFNVTNGPVTTWQRVSDSYRYGSRPAAYDHMTATHPSIYDDFDSIMAAARLLSADGAGYALDGGAWSAAYDYYGHDATGVLYADEVLARAIGWSQHGFCFNCGVDPVMVRAVHGAYGGPVLLAPASAPAPRAKAARVAR